MRVGRRKIGSRQLTATACEVASVMPSDATRRNFITCSSAVRLGKLGLQVGRDLPVRASDVDVEQVVLHVGDQAGEDSRGRRAPSACRAAPTSPRLPDPDPPWRTPWTCPRRSRRANPAGSRAARCPSPSPARMSMRERMCAIRAAEIVSGWPKPFGSVSPPLLLAAQDHARLVLLEDRLLHGSA